MRPRAHDLTPRVRRCCQCDKPAERTTLGFCDACVEKMTGPVVYDRDQKGDK